MKMNKKGSELSMNVIIIAAIALLVLVILAVMLLQKGGDLKEGTSCESLGGKCCYSCGESCSENGVTYSIHNTPADSSCSGDQICCLRLGDDKNNR
ncbi:MAG: DUF948 domain-containing protein [Candidatus Woesearchaeota archaeon]